MFASMILLTSCSKEEINKNENTSTQQNLNLQLFLDQDFVQLYNADNDFIQLLEGLNIEEGAAYENLLFNLENIETENDLLSALNGYGPINNNEVLDYVNIRHDLTTRIFNEYLDLLDLTNSQLSEYWAQEWLVLKNMTAISGQLQADKDYCYDSFWMDVAKSVGLGAVGSLATPAVGAALLSIHYLSARITLHRCLKKAHADYDRLQK